MPGCVSVHVSHEDTLQLAMNAGVHACACEPRKHFAISNERRDALCEHASHKEKLNTDANCQLVANR